jgi:hypothetical protein
MMALSTLALSSKMANSLSTSNRLHKTYGPVQLVSARDGPDESSRLAVPKFQIGDQVFA